MPEFWCPRLKALLALGMAGSASYSSVAMDWLDVVEAPESTRMNDCMLVSAATDGNLRVLVAELLMLHQRFDDGVRYAQGELVRGLL